MIDFNKEFSCKVYSWKFLVVYWNSFVLFQSNHSSSYNVYSLKYRFCRKSSRCKKFWWSQQYVWSWNKSHRDGIAC